MQMTVSATPFAFSKTRVGAIAEPSQQNRDSCSIINNSEDTLTIDSIFIDTIIGIKYSSRAEAVFASFVFSFGLKPQNNDLYLIAYSIGESSIPYGDSYYAKKIRVLPHDAIIMTHISAQCNQVAAKWSPQQNPMNTPIEAAIVFKSGTTADTLWCDGLAIVPAQTYIGSPAQHPNQRANRVDSPARFDLRGRREELQNPRRETFTPHFLNPSFIAGEKSGSEASE